MIVAKISWTMRWLAILLAGMLGAGALEAVALEPLDIEIEGELGTFEAEWKLEGDGALRTLRIALVAPEAAPPPRIQVTWRVPSIDVAGYWHPAIAIDKANYYRNRVESRAARNAPVVALLSAADRNRMTVAVSDALRKVSVGSYVKEEDAHFHFYVELFAEPEPALERYEVSVRIDGRDIRYEQALADVAAWWARQDGYLPAPVPAAAREPMVSTWYSFHQNLDRDELMAELRLAKPLGYEAVIVDDGWQTLDGNRGYAYTGDWKPERLTDMRALVDEVHALGMKFLLWYSLPFVGEKAESFARFEGKYLRYWESQGTYVLDPRYPEVREALIETYEKALVDWDLDGFKLDFIDRFMPTEDTELTAADGRDYASVDEAVDRLMTDIMARLRRLRPAVMIEFRQRYIGPLMRKYGNMFRAVDCPNNAVANRVETTDLRLLSGTTAVHSDMLMWHPDEPVEQAAQQMLNVLFSVPQLSVKLAQVPEDHRAMVAFWTGYWRANREVLLDGTFRATRPAALYPILRAEAADKTIVGLYEPMVIDIDRDTAFDVVNATPSDAIVLRIAADLGHRIVRVRDTAGKLVTEEKVDLRAGLREVAVPPSGLVEVSSATAARR